MYDSKGYSGQGLGSGGGMTQEPGARRVGEITPDPGTRVGE